MLKYLLAKLLRHPVWTIRQAVYKTLIGPLKYRRGKGYDAGRYWSDRFSRYGMAGRGAGDEGLTDEENRRAFEPAGRRFLELCRAQGVDFPAAAVLEIGVGTGLYTELLRGAGVRRYLGLDITDVLFGRLQRQFPEYNFSRCDVTTDKIDGQFDLIVMMDVIEHIVEAPKLAAAMANLRGCLAEGGLLFLSGVSSKTKRYLFYVKGWSAADVLKHFPGYAQKGPLPYRQNNLLILRRPE